MISDQSVARSRQAAEERVANANKWAEERYVRLVEHTDARVKQINSDCDDRIRSYRRYSLFMFVLGFTIATVVPILVRWLI